MTEYDLIVIGAGPAGLAAAMEARESGIEKILVVDREEEAGGILRQCIHTGFGLHTFGKDLTGPEYAEYFIGRVNELGVELKLDTMVIDIDRNKRVTMMNKSEGVTSIGAKAVILAMGCRERTRGALRIPGNRPAGIFTAGTAQKFVNINGYMPGNEVVILGSGDIGLIMARRLTLEGATVKAVCELNPYPGGLTRNIVQCLNDFNIPLMLSTTVVKIHGEDRVSGVTVARVDKNLKPIPETEEFIECDTLLLSVGLIPENELSQKAGIEIDRITGGAIVNERNETSVSGIFACGNVLHVHDLVDYVTLEGRRAGKNAAIYIKGLSSGEPCCIKVECEKPVRYVVPQCISSLQEEVEFFFRVDNIYSELKFRIYSNGGLIKEFTRKHLAPGEMQRIKLSKNEMKQITGGKLEIRAFTAGGEQ